MAFSDRVRVMVVDDDAVFRNFLATILRRDYLVSVASQGLEAFRKACEHPPRLLVIDIQMPGWDGLKTIQAFRAHPSLSRVGIMVLTSDTTRQTVEAAIRAGADEYLVKTGFSTSEFLLKLTQLRRRLDERIMLPPARAQATPVVPPEALLSGSPPELPPALSEPMHNLQEVLDSWE